MAFMQVCAYRFLVCVPLRVFLRGHVVLLVLCE